MFKFLKDKLKSAISIFTEKAEKPEETPGAEAPVEAPQEREIHPQEVPEEPSVEEQPEEEKAGQPSVEKEVSEVPAQGHTEPLEDEHREIPEEIPQVVQREAEKPKEVLLKSHPKVAVQWKERKPVEEPKVSAPREEAEEQPATAETPAPVQKKGFFSRIKQRFTETKSEQREDPLVPQAPSTAEKKGMFARLKEKVQTVTISEERFEELFWDLEVVLLENSVAVEVIEKIKEDLKHKLVDQPLQRGGVSDSIVAALKSSIEGLFAVSENDLVQKVRSKKPYVICFVGVNGSGKTTTIAKVAHLLKENGLSVVLAAADTFRAAAIDQLELHARRLGVKLIKHDYGSDAAAVAFDAIKHAEAKNRDVVLIDTAGRLHSNTNLMDELKKVVRVAKPDLTIFVGEAITGNDCVEQAKLFNDAVNIDAIILSKADVDEKGGAAISISHVTGKPILFLGTGQGYGDLTPFDSQAVMHQLGLTAS